MYSYRGYSGETFNKGVLNTKKIGKFHPNDVVSCIADLVAGTITFKVNGVIQGEGPTFTGVIGPLFPCIMMYGVDRIVKVNN